MDDTGCDGTGMTACIFYWILLKECAYFLLVSAWRPPRPRRVFLLCPGHMRAGTRALVRLFARAGFRACHEPDSVKLCCYILARPSIPFCVRRVFLLLRDRRQQFDLEASIFLAFMLDDMRRTFPAAQWVVLHRDIASWRVSIQTNLDADLAHLSPKNYALHARTFETHAARHALLTWDDVYAWCEAQFSTLPDVYVLPQETLRLMRSPYAILKKIT